MNFAPITSCINLILLFLYFEYFLDTCNFKFIAYSLKTDENWCEISLMKIERNCPFSSL